MRQASFTVTVKNEDGRDVRYCADSLQVTMRSVAGGMISCLAFVCSGTLKEVPASDVAAVEFSPNGAQHCNRCDQSVWGFVGAGIHANPPAAGSTPDPSGSASPTLPPSRACARCRGTGHFSEGPPEPGEPISDPRNTECPRCDGTGKEPSSGIETA